MFCEWDKDLELKVVKQPSGTNQYALPKNKPYAVRRTYNGAVVGYLGEFAAKSEAELYMLHYATN